MIPEQLRGGGVNCLGSGLNILVIFKLKLCGFQATNIIPTQFIIMPSFAEIGGPM
jgi:hypothetical protein